MKKLFMLFIVFTGLWAVPVIAAECETCHDPGVQAVDNSKWSEVMTKLAITAGIPTAYDINGDPVIAGSYPRYKAEDCYSTVGLNTPTYTKEQLAHDTSLPESDMIQVNPGSMSEGVATSGFLIRSSMKALC